MICAANLFKLTWICELALGILRGCSHPGRVLMPRRSLLLCKPSPDCVSGNVLGYCSALQLGYYGPGADSALQSLYPAGERRQYC